MTLIPDMSAILQQGARLMYDREVTVYKGAGGEGLDEGLVDWDDPEQVGEPVKGSLQPVKAAAQVAAGLEVKVGRWNLYCDLVEISPESNRVKIGETFFEVMDVNVYPSHIEALLEEV